jgi:hypothetical protein
MCISLGTQPGAFAEEPRETALRFISHAAAAVAVSAGAPTDWRLCQIVTAIELFEQDWFDLAAEQARRAVLPIEKIPDDERGMTCAQPFGVVMHAVRRLKDGASPAPARNVFFAMAFARVA